MADVVAVLLAALVAHVAPVPALLATVAALCVVRAADLHRPRLVLSIAEDLAGLVVAAAAATAVVVAAGEAALTFALLALACLVLAHTLVHSGAQLLRRTGRSSRRVVVVGTGEVGRRLGATLLARPELGLEPVGCVATGAETDLAQTHGLPLPLLGAVTELPRAMTEARVDAVVVALPGPASDAETAAVGGLLASAAEVYAVPAHFPPVHAHARHPRELVDGVPVVHLHPRRAWPPVRAAKRAVEVLAALVALVALALPLALLGLLARVTRRVRLRSGLAALQEAARAQLRRVRHPGGVAEPGQLLTTAPLAHEAQVDTGQLTR